MADEISSDRSARVSEEKIRVRLEAALGGLPALPGGDTQARTPSKSPTRLAFDRLRKDRVAMVSLGIVILFILLAVFAPLLAALEGQSPTALHTELVDDYLQPLDRGSAQHWFGVEPRNGHDLFARWVYGARPSLIVGFSVTFITTIAGVTAGLIAGFAGGLADRVIGWLVDFVLSLPALLFAIAVPQILLLVFYDVPEDANLSDVGRVRFISLISVLSFLGWAGLSRLIRGQVLSLREREFIAAARVLGVPRWRILFRELLPNLIAPIVVYVSLAIPGYVIVEAVLSILGVGLSATEPSWGNMINNAQAWAITYPIYLWMPVLGITVLVLALSLFGDAVRDAFDPKTR